MFNIRKWILNNKNSRPPFLTPPLRAPGEAIGFKLDDELMNFTLFAIGVPIFLLCLSYTYQELMINIPL